MSLIIIFNPWRVKKKKKLIFPSSNYDKVKKEMYLTMRKAWLLKIEEFVLKIFCN